MRQVTLRAWLFYALLAALLGTGAENIYQGWVIGGQRIVIQDMTTNPACMMPAAPAKPLPSVNKAAEPEHHYTDPRALLTT